MKNERKGALVTLRVTNEEMSTLDYLSESTGKSKSDVISRACRYFLNTAEEDLGINLEGGLNGKGTDGRHRDRKTVKIHARVPDSVADGLKNACEERGSSVSGLVRTAIKAFASVADYRY